MQYRKKYRIEPTRLQSWDYSSPACYFITICVRNRLPIFGNISNNTMILNRYGQIVNEEWHRTFEIRPELSPDEFIVMPDHFHAIVHTVETPCHGVSTRWKSGVLGSIIGQFKQQVTKRIRKNGIPNFRWQARFHDHIIRNEQALYRIRQYIRNNPNQ